MHAFADRRPPLQGPVTVLKDTVEQLVRTALERLADSIVPAEALPAELTVERTRDSRHGDFATNAAMALAKPAGRKPRELAEAIVEAMPDAPEIERVEIAGPGFINFFLASAAFHREVTRALTEPESYQRPDTGRGARVQIEFVSANPTGPLHVGHGRGAAYGASLAAILEAAGYVVHREYYVNDAGRQMDILALSVWLRYLERRGAGVSRFPEAGYHGDYVHDLADRLADEQGDALVPDTLGMDEDLASDPDQAADELVARCRARLGDEGYAVLHRTAVTAILGIIKADLAEFGVTYDQWFSERELVADGAVARTLERLETAGWLYRAEGATWFRAAALGDDKDRVVIRESGAPTYFAADIAYHLDKVDRGFDTLLDVWGADHHGYVSRIRAALRALGVPDERLAVLLVQFANLYRGGEKIPMSTRAGRFVTLRELVDEVGGDAARFFYVLRSSEQHLDFDLDLAKSQSQDNPVYYVQYAHARVCSVMAQLEAKGLEFDPDNGLAQLERLTEAHEITLMQAISRYPEIIEMAARNSAPHHLAHHLRDLAAALHTYYNAHTFLNDDPGLRDARLALVLAARGLIAAGLSLLGVSAPEKM